ncbi:hypothetical protein PAPYR_7724 [Paratrimastix pyriformis]|uniref:Uncharacterized protein n=1 Tax=Paratrimastix pyriformis TaxID=342808 RepID=A0ABQ8UCA6_9EUKA|nr:hypothetical protein PAPYR_7724 [Paratrimastix pyriformis]
MSDQIPAVSVTVNPLGPAAAQPSLTLSVAQSPAAACDVVTPAAITLQVGGPAPSPAPAAAVAMVAVPAATAPLAVAVAAGPATAAAEIGMVAVPTQAPVNPADVLIRSQLQAVSPNITQDQALESLLAWAKVTKCASSGVIKQLNVTKFQRVDAVTTFEAREIRETLRPCPSNYDQPAGVGIGGFMPDPWSVPCQPRKGWYKDDLVEIPIPHTEEVRRCGNCEGRGRVQCNNCPGTGRIPCSQCNGAGCHYGSDGSRSGCANCNSHGYNMCPHCTDGVAECGQCQQQGRIIRYKVATTPPPAPLVSIPPRSITLPPMVSTAPWSPPPHGPPPPHGIHHPMVSTTTPWYPPPPHGIHHHPMVSTTTPWYPPPPHGIHHPMVSTTPWSTTPWYPPPHGIHHLMAIFVGYNVVTQNVTLDGDQRLLAGFDKGLLKKAPGADMWKEEAPRIFPVRPATMPTQGHQPHTEGHHQHTLTQGHQPHMKSFPPRNGIPSP